MEKRRMSLYGTILFLSFFLIVTFFFSSHSIDYASELVAVTTSSSSLETVKKSAAGTSSDKQTKETETTEPAPIPANQTTTPIQESEVLSAYYRKVQQVLEKAAASFDGEIGLTYIDIETGKQLSVNGKKEFYSASTIKVPLSMLISDMVEEGKLDWHTEVAYNAAEDYEEGTGRIIYNIQPSYSLEELQEYNITYSDNIAKNMLYGVLGGDEQAKKKFYARYLQKTTIWDDARFTSEDAAKILSILFEGKKTKSGYQQIYDFMKNTAFHERLETELTTGKVAHKIGSYDNFIHDMGILETSKPFILTVFTNGQNGKECIQQLANTLWQLQQNDYPTETKND